MLDEVARLGNRVAHQWKTAGHDPDAFADIARLALQQSRLHESYRVEEIAHWLADAADFPQQFGLGSLFGEPPLTLFMNGEAGFAVEIYYWLHTDTSIHDHGFAGACTVLQGRSLHVVHRFEATRQQGELFLGELTPTETTLLRAGDTFAIPSGERFIHQVCHLSEPTVSLVVRTISDIGVTQRDYYPPHYSLPPRGQTEERRSRAHRFLATLRATKPELAENVEPSLCRARDATSAFIALRDQLWRANDGEAEWQSVLASESPELPGLRAVATQWASHSRLAFEGVSEGTKLLAALILNFGFSEPTFRVLRQFHQTDNLFSPILLSLRELLSARPLNPRLLQDATLILEQKQKTGSPLSPTEYSWSGMDREIARRWNLYALAAYFTKHPLS